MPLGVGVIGIVMVLLTASVVIAIVLATLALMPVVPLSAELILKVKNRLPEIRASRKTAQKRAIDLSCFDMCIVYLFCMVETFYATNLA